MPPKNTNDEQEQAEQKAQQERKRAAAGHPAGEFRVYRSFDTTAPGGGQERDQLVFVTGHSDTGHVYGKPLGWADEGGQFEPGQLRKVGTEDGGGRDGGG